jgi:hypothetical protein
VDTKQILWPGLDNKNPTIDVGFPEIDTLYAVTVSFFDSEEYCSVYFWTERLDSKVRHPANDARVCMHGPVEIPRKGIWDSLHFLRWGPKVKGPRSTIMSMLKIIRHDVTIIFSMVKPKGMTIVAKIKLPDTHTPARNYVTVSSSTGPIMPYFFEYNFF